MFTMPRACARAVVAGRPARVGRGAERPDLVGNDPAGRRAGSAEHDAAARHVEDGRRAVGRSRAGGKTGSAECAGGAALDGQNIRLPGYIVPLEVNEEGRTTDFLLVPYFGACIHVPPPPSNQIVHVKSELGVKLDELYQPYWVEGPLQVKASSSELADAGYQMEADKIYVYELPE
jgi:hypothetical protein